MNKKNLKRQNKRKRNSYTLLGQIAERWVDSVERCGGTDDSTEFGDRASGKVKHTILPPWRCSSSQVLACATGLALNRRGKGMSTPRGRFFIATDTAGRKETIVNTGTNHQWRSGNWGRQGHAGMSQQASHSWRSHLQKQIASAGGAVVDIIKVWIWVSGQLLQFPGVRNRDRDDLLSGVFV